MEYPPAAFMGLFYLGLRRPFLSIYRVGPLPSFYLEAGSLLGATIFSIGFGI